MMATTGTNTLNTTPSAGASNPPSAMDSSSASQSGLPGAARRLSSRHRLRRTSGGSTATIRKKQAPSFQASQSKKYAGWYHKMAEQHRLGSITELAMSELDSSVSGELPPSETELPTNRQFALMYSPTSRCVDCQKKANQCTCDGDNNNKNNINTKTLRRSMTKVQEAKTEILNELNRTKGETTAGVQQALQTLLSNYDASHWNPRAPVNTKDTNVLNVRAHTMEGVGLSAGKPTFPGCIGKNDKGDPMYKLGTMAFDMFRPTQLVVSVQGSFLWIDVVDGKEQSVKHVPSSLLQEVKFGKAPLRHYDVITAFTIEPWRPEFGTDSPNMGVEEPIRGCMTTYGFALPYPKGNRFSVWFTGGAIEVDNQESDKWFKIFGKAPSRSLVESSRVLAARLLVGATADDTMDENGRLSYELTRPKASHIDLLYLDESLQILRGSSGTLYVHVRLAAGMLFCNHSKQQQEGSPLLAGVPANSSNRMTPPLTNNNLRNDTYRVGTNFSSNNNNNNNNKSLGMDHAPSRKGGMVRPSPVRPMRGMAA